LWRDFLYLNQVANENRRKSWFDYKRKADGSIPFGKADERSERSVSEVIQSSRPNTKKPALVAGFFVFKA